MSVTPGTSRVAPIESPRRVLSPILRSPTTSESNPDVKIKPPKTPILTTRQSDFAVSLDNYIMDSLLLEVCFEVHREASLLADAGLPAVPESPEDRTTGMNRVSRLRNGFGGTDDVVILCPECNKSMSVKVFAQHLEQHSGGGRISSRTARKKLAEDHMNEIQVAFDDDYDIVENQGPLLSPPSGDDDDWNLSRKKRRTQQKSKKKKLN